ncbi:uncharacterized protein LOC131938641 isoform X2 [Physella acuta]|uniref:uncharacterized protein LOC131938641 isoform X2 n=1 Tax=Physella acuta TaxID=109671 RepID=UPI0027DD6CE9|nr:uncharacterized protein LOC131938641 isoform X2 [Physella acuta]
MYSFTKSLFDAKLRILKARCAKFIRRLLRLPLLLLAWYLHWTLKAAGVVCLIGLGLSLGTLLLYRLYFRIIVPFLNSVWTSKGKNGLLDDEYTLYLEPSDSEVDEDKMGNSNSKKSTPSVYYAPGYGVSLGSRPPTLEAEEGIRLRPRKPHHSRPKSPSPASDKDSAIGVGGSEMSQSLYSENSANRDSFYSTCTAESGYDEFGYLEECRGSKLSSSLKENFSPGSLKERNLQMLYRAHHGHDAGLNSIGRSAKPGLDTLSDCSSEKSGILSSRSYPSTADTDSSYINLSLRSNVDPLVEKFASEQASRTGSRQSSLGKPGLPCHMTENTGVNHTSCQETDFTTFSPKVLSTESSPCHRNRVPATRGRSAVRGHLPGRTQEWSRGEDQEMDYDPSLDASESLRSFNSSLEEIDWDAEDDSRDKMSALPQFQQSDSDLQFKQSLMQRIHEWSSFAEEYNKSRSPTPDCLPVRFVRRSRSLDRHLGDPSSILISDAADIAATAKPIEIEPTTEKNLESLEYELHDIQGEFESITSKLHELIENGNAEPSLTGSKSSTTHKPHHAHSKPRAIDSKVLGKMRTKWERVPSSACSDSSRSSRASSVEYVWDLADYSHTGERLRSDSLLGDGDITLLPGQDGAGQVAMELDHTEVGVTNISTPMLIAEYAEKEWKGDTDKAKTMKEGYKQITPVLSQHRLCVIRGDNYCALRSVLFQVLVNGERVTQRWSGIIGIMDSLHDLYSDPSINFPSWTFANRLPGHCKDRLASLSKCALSLYATIEEVCNLPSREEREKRTICLLNTNATFDLELMEGLKIMMLLNLVNLRCQMDDGEDVPIFSHLLFARDTSETVSDFLKNHLNTVGDSGGLEQVEMCLLGYTLGVRIRVLRLAQCGQQDFDCMFPDDVPADWPEVDLIAEDDRHYNVPLP